MNALSRAERLQKSEEGFTLVELLVVILVIGILAAIAVPALMNQRKAANDAAVESDIRNVAMTVETMLITNPNPSSIEIDTYEGGTGDLLMASIAPTPSRNHTTVQFDGGKEEGGIEQQVLLSSGVRITIETSSEEEDPGAFAFKGTHDNGKQYNKGDDTWLIYDSMRGGVIKEDPADGDIGAGGDDGTGDEGEEEGALECSAYESEWEDFKVTAKGGVSKYEGVTGADYVSTGETGLIKYTAPKAPGEDDPYPSSDDDQYGGFDNTEVWGAEIYFEADPEFGWGADRGILMFGNEECKYGQW